MLKKYVTLVPLLLSGCIAPLAVGGIGSLGLSAVEERGLDGVASDQALRLKINSELFDNYDFIGLNLTLYKGRVLVTGTVPNAQAKEQVLALIKNVAGVKEVIDGIQVYKEDQFLEDAQDTWFTARLKASLYLDQDIYAPNFIIHTFDRVIYIFGTAGTPEEMELVLSNAREIEGVRRVVNLIECKGKS